ncbi:type II toxin-antitoxin system death-on-curing family toxin [Sandaracinus amylolyticus]|uniref:type II toxin-antitoxin system death-on-curing family toxin n=1 Tax=Sandaracinus amylolyticus TaxID=927083 RepID=UPI001F223FAC|nr:Fic family protein [Sandaracinus amylolyticus]UJR82824.1 Hypothetical protein I5071_48890 [Sandaracinus amylolyticus]
MTADELIAPARVWDLHAKIIARWGGLPGERERGCVDAKIEGALTAALYACDEGEEPDVLSVAVHLLVYFAQSQCFVDGSKRVAWATMNEQLHAAGLRIVATPEDAAELVLAVSNKKLGAADVLAWLVEPGRLAAWDPR